MASNKTSALSLYAYQKRLILDESRFIAALYARQTGKSFAFAAKQVLDCREHEKTDWVAISSGQRQVKEYMDKVRTHGRATGLVLEWAEQTYRYALDDGTTDEYTVLECKFQNGSRIVGVPANPDTARGYSANVFMDELAAIKNGRELWAAVFPIVSRGFKLHAAFTPKGKQNKAYEIWQNPNFTKHFVDIYQAVREGCPHDVELLRSTIGDPDLWAQEYECKFLDEATAFITYDLINEVEHPLAGKPELYAGGATFVGMDIGRRKDLTAIHVLELVGDVLWVRERITLSKTTFTAQEQELARVITQYKPSRVCIDQTGMGEMFAERAKDKYGRQVEGVLFSSSVKLDLANGIKQQCEDHKLRIPAIDALRESIHSIKKTTTAAGNARFDAERSEHGHADEFWALALAAHAADRPAGVAVREIDMAEEERAVEDEYGEEVEYNGAAFGGHSTGERHGLN